MEKMNISENQKKEFTVEYEGFPSCEIEFVSATEWTNREGVDVCANDKQIQLTWSEWDAMIAAVQLSRLHWKKSDNKK